MPRPASAATAAPHSPTRLALYAAAGLLGVDLLAAWLLLPAERPSTATAVVLACASPRVLIPHMLGCAGLGLLLQRHYHALIQAPGAAFGFVLASLLGPIGERVYAVVNYDHFHIDPDLQDAWAAMVSDLIERYYRNVTRYSTSSFLRAKLGPALAARGVAPHLYESAEEARGHLYGRGE